MNRVKIYGEGTLRCWNKDGSLAWLRQFRNSPTTNGLAYLASSGFANASQITTWYAGLINLTGFNALAIGDTAALHAGWLEFTGYSGNRPTWTNAGANGVVNSNGPFTFPITSNGVVHGFFIASNATPGSASGTLWATAILSSDAVVSAGQNLTGLYSVTLVGG